MDLVIIVFVIGHFLSHVRRKQPTKKKKTKQLGGGVTNRNNSESYPEVFLIHIFKFQQQQKKKQNKTKKYKYKTKQRTKKNNLCVVHDLIKSSKHTLDPNAH